MLGGTIFLVSGLLLFQRDQVCHTHLSNNPLRKRAVPNTSQPSYPRPYDCLQPRRLKNCVTGHPPAEQIFLSNFSSRSSRERMISAAY